MSKKRKRENDEKELNVVLPQTFREITHLTNIELNSLLRQFDLPTKGKRTHRYTILASHLNISTADGGDSDPFLHTLKEIQSLREGWVKDIRQVPHVTLESIKRYLSASHDIAATVTAGAFEKYTDETLRSYKALRAYDLWESGHISGYMFNGLDNIDHFCALQCLANPSGDTSGTQYSVTVVLNDNGAPVGAACTCIAGLGEACTHIAGLLFGIEDFVARGHRDLPDDEGLTEKLCRWTVPKGPKVDPKPIKDVVVKKNVPGKFRQEKKFNVTDYEPLPPAVRTVDYDSLTLLHHTLSLQCPNLPWVQAVAPAITQKYKANDGDRHVIPKGPTFLPGVVSDDNPVLIPTRDISVKTENIPITLKDKLKLASTSDLVTYTTEEKKSIEVITRKQKESAHWLRYRQGIITASNFNRVISHSKKLLKKGENSATDNLVDMLINGSNFKGNKATRYGNRQEPHAASLYVDKMTTDHANCSLRTCGLHICKSFEYLGASPDRIFKCACHGKRLVEIKCPFTLVDKSRKIDSLDFITKDENGILKLKTTGNTYYDQIQGQMGVTGIHKCDLVVFDGTNIVVIKVEFDGPYWQNMTDALLDFYIDYVYVKMATKDPLCGIQAGRNNVQSAISERTKRFPCGECGQILEEIVCNDSEASINCECPCKCRKWFHWKCVNFSPDPELDMEPAWHCPPCVRNCDIVM